MRKLTVCLLATSLTLTSTGPLFAQDAESLEGVRRTTAEDTLRSWGYRTAGTNNIDGRNWEMWQRGRSCIGISPRAGMVEQASTFNAQQCRNNAGSGGGGGGNTGAAVAGVAVAALLGAALLSHHDKHYEQGYRPSNNNATANFERGYQDGLHDGPFTSSGSNPDYNQGYNAGQQERTNRLRSNRESWSVGGGKAAAKAACAKYADEEWGLEPGSAYTTSVRGDGSTFYEVDVTAGYSNGTCTIQNGRVTNLG